MPPPHHDHHHDHHHGHHHPKHHHEMEDYDDYDWKDLPPHLKEAATTLGWNQKIWDEDGKADTEDLDWEELSHEQRKAAEQFGYHPKLWNEGEGHKHPPPPHHHDHHHDHHHHHPHDNHHKPEPSKEEEEKKDGDDDDEDVDVDVSKLDVNDVEEAYQEDDSKQEAKKKKPLFKLSKSYGGDGGDKFDHGNNRHISKISIFTDGHVVKGLEVSYANATKKTGSCSGKSTAFELERGEFITGAQVRSNRYVQSLGFKTNKGKMLGPVGGKGWTKVDLRGKDTEGEEVKVNAPFKYQLSGLTGRAGASIDQIAFRWGPVPQQAKQNK